jgi:PKD repeat protein
LANPTSTQAVDVQRRLDVQLRNIAYNTQLREVCATFVRCRFDNNAVFDTQFATSDIAGDYFHPSIAGQAKLASVSWSVGYAWATSPPPNVAPTASFTSSCVDLTCTFTDTSSDSDGTISIRSWTFGDSGTSPAANPSHTYAATGTYPVVLNVTDDGGATAAASSTVTVSSPPTAKDMWVRGLTATAKSGRNGWTATVTIQVADAAGAVAGVSVTGAWSAGTGVTTCATGTDGTCTVKSSSLSKKSTSSVTFTVSGLAKTGWTYDRNVGPTSITVPKP